jgi:type IV pilus assembly protein PilM
MPPSLNLKLSLPRRSASDLVGLDIQPGLVAAVQARTNGSVLCERAVALPLAADTVREGDVVDADALSDTLRKLFSEMRLSKRVRVGVANQRTVMRTLELPPVSDAKELAAAVQFQAQDQVPMPLANAVLDFQPLGVVDTPAGPRQKVVLVAAQRDMVERLLAAVRGAGLTPVGLDMSAFALIRSLYRKDANSSERVLYLNVDGLTNVAIAEGTVCRFTRVLGGGIEEMASELAERTSMPLAHARGLLAEVDLAASATPQSVQTLPPENLESPAPGASEPHGFAEPAPSYAPEGEASAFAQPDPAGLEAHEPTDYSAHFAQAPPPGSMGAGEAAPAAEEFGGAQEPSIQDVARSVLENGVRTIAGEVRNSLDFHRSQEGGGDVARVMLSGSALDLPGFAEALETSLGVEVQSATVGLADGSRVQGVSPHRLAIATGLATAEVPE